MGPMIEEDIDTLVEENFSLADLLDRFHAIVLYNDEVNTFDHVINCLVKYCGHEAIQAEQCALIVHTKGKCRVKEGPFDNLRPINEALQENGLSSIIE
jgi:ATP-dependent Clp protease adaptor protein ClpS